MARKIEEGTKASTWGDVLNFPKKARLYRTELTRLMKQDPELQEFCTFVHQNNLREKAIELISRRISIDGNCPH